MGKKKKKELVVLTVFNGGKDGAVVAAKAGAYKLEWGQALILHWDGAAVVTSLESPARHDDMLSDALDYDPMEDIRSLTTMCGKNPTSGSRDDEKGGES